MQRNVPASQLTAPEKEDAELVLPPFVVANRWASLRQFTDARIALGRTGVSLPTQAQLAFQLAHAQARDAVHLPLDVEQLAHDLVAAGLVRHARDCLQLHSAAANRLIYLQRPDLGRRLNDGSRAALQARAVGVLSPTRHDLAVVVADGLSALAVASHAVPFLQHLMPLVAAENWSSAPIVMVRMGRVAVGDEVGELLGASVVVLLIGERPGLSSPDSMGIYVTWSPTVGRTDADRNCISNVRPAGLSLSEAAAKLHYLMLQMHQRQLSGVHLKDDASPSEPTLPRPDGNFLLGSASSRGGPSVGGSAGPTSHG